MKLAALAMDKLRAVVQQLPDDALTPSRQAALASLDERGLPTVRHEDWKYTDIGAAVDISNRWLATGSGISSSALLDSQIESITSTIHSHPTLSEAVQEAFNSVYGMAINP